MELDRNAIERSDFAQARRGYDPEEVDAHLAQVATAYEDLKAQPAPASTTMAGAAADQVRSIVEAAEQIAQEIESSARDEAERANADAKQQAEQELAHARSDAAEARQRAQAEAEAHVTSVRDATAELRARAEAMQADLNGMVEKLRESIDAVVDSARSNASSLEQELQAQQTSGVPAAEAAVETAPPLVAEPTPGPVDQPEAGGIPAVPEAEPEPATAYDEELLDEPVADAGEEPVAEPELVSEEPEAQAPAGGGGDGAEGARLIALNMALNGTPREETSRYLEENFNLENRDSILDEVYSRVSG